MNWNKGRKISNSIVAVLVADRILINETGLNNIFTNGCEIGSC